MTHAYLFEAKSIQSYIFATNRLKEIIGGSELIESIAGDNGLITSLVNSLSLSITFSRQGGGAFYAFGDEKDITTLKTLWPLLIRQYAPDLVFIHAYSSGSTTKEANDHAQKLLLLDNSRPKVSLPSVSVFAKRSQRTGAVATNYHYKKEVPEAIDQPTHRKLEFEESEQLVKRFDPHSTKANWPVNLTPEVGQDHKNFPFIKGSQIALIHADGNGLGQLFKNIKEATKDRPEDFIEIYKSFSEALKKATEGAAQSAVDKTLKKHCKKTKKGQDLYPARPIVLGGDDLTIIVRADLALSFTNAFLQAFEKFSEAELTPLQQKFQLEGFPKRLTACAGVVFAKASQPFYLLHDLAEDLCRHAKVRAKSRGFEETPSSIAFHRVTTSLTESYQNILASELTAGNLRQTLEVYAINKNLKLPVLQDLFHLQAVMSESEVSKGATRQLLGLVSQSPELASRRYSRWREVMSEDDTKAELLARYEGLVDTLLTSFNQGAKFGAEAFDESTKPTTTSPTYTPFEDIMALIAVDNTVTSPIQNKPEEEKCHTS